MRPDTCTRSAFTLIELLVVISIVAVLAGMLLPALVMVRSSARASVCAGSLRQLGIANVAYADDWDGVLTAIRRPVAGSVTSKHWFQSLSPYLDVIADGSDGGTYTEMATLRNAGQNPVWGCPEWNSAKRGNIGALPSNSKPGYGQNLFPLKQSGDLANNANSDYFAGAFGLPVRDFTRSQILLASSRICQGDADDWYLTVWSNGSPTLGTGGGGGDERHRGRRNNFLFFDGHVAGVALSVAGYGVSEPTKLP